MNVGVGFFSMICLLGKVSWRKGLWLFTKGIIKGQIKVWKFGNTLVILCVFGTRCREETEVAACIFDWNWATSLEERWGSWREMKGERGREERKEGRRKEERENNLILAIHQICNLGKLVKIRIFF